MSGKRLWTAMLLAAVSSAAAGYALGYRVPEDHTATVTGIVHAPQERVWELVSDIPQGTNWRTGIRYMKHLEPQNGSYCWEESQSEVAVPFCVQEQRPPTRQVIQIVRAPKGEKESPFRGTWTWELTPSGTADTRVTITERITRRPPIWRFIQHYVTKEDSAVNRYLADLQVEAVRQR